MASPAQAVRMTPEMLWRGLRTRVGTRRMRRNAFLELVMPSSLLAAVDRVQLAEDLRPLFGHDLADQPPIVMKQLRAMGRYDASDRLSQLGTIPTLVVSATEDHIALPAFGRELADAIPGARFLQIDDAGHGLPIQRREEVNAVLAAHFTVADRKASPRRQIR